MGANWLRALKSNGSVNHSAPVLELSHMAAPLAHSGLNTVETFEAVAASMSQVRYDWYSRHLQPNQWKIL